MSDTSNQYLSWDQDPRNPKNRRVQQGGAAYNVPGNQNFVGPTMDPEVIQGRTTGAYSDTLTPEEAAARAGITLGGGGGVPGQSGRQARQQLLDLRRGYQDYMLGSQNQLRNLRAQEAEAREAFGSSAASREVGGAGPARGLENLLGRYREPQARIMGQQALTEANLGRDVASVRNLLAQRRFEEALKRAAGVANYWQRVIANYAQPSTELDAMLKQLGVGE